MLIVIEVVRRFYKFRLVLSESCVVSVGVQRVSAILAHQIIIISEIIILIRVQESVVFEGLNRGRDHMGHYIGCLLVSFLHLNRRAVPTLPRWAVALCP